MVYEYYSNQYVYNLQFNPDDVKEEVIKCNYASKEEIEKDEEKIIVMYLKQKYRNEIKKYFEQWNHDKFREADKRYIK